MLQTLFKTSLLGQIHQAVCSEQMYVDGHHPVSALASFSLQMSQNDPWLKHRSINFHLGCTVVSHIKLISPDWALKPSCEVSTIRILLLYKTRKDIFIYLFFFLTFILCWNFRRWGFNPWIRKIPWRRKWKPTPVFLPGQSHEQRGLAGNSP